MVSPSPKLILRETASFGLSDSPPDSWDWSSGWSWMGAHVKSQGACTSSVGPGSFAAVGGASFAAKCTCSTAFSPGGTRSLGLYMRVVGYVLGTDGSLRGAGPVRRAL